MLIAGLLAAILLAGDTQTVSSNGPLLNAPQIELPLNAEQAGQLKAALKEAEAQGLGQSFLPGEQAGTLSQAELRAAALRYAWAQQGLAAGLDRDWAMMREAGDLSQGFDVAVASDTLPDWLNALPPPFEPYRLLKDGLARYRVMAEAGGWPLLPDELTLKPGEPSAGVPFLRRRLAAEGYALPETEQPELFDPGLRDALIMFQERHGLPPTGLLDRTTIKALNVPVSTRITQIEANLERWRWVRRPLPPRRIEINTADAMLHLYIEAKPVLAMRVVVGRPKDPTPVLEDAITSVTFNPAWLVPQGIATREILPKAERDPGYLAREGFVFVPDKTSPSRMRLQQQPGPKNALGKLRFNLGNAFGVYLHDTPDKKKFEARRRLFSHGCIRLEDVRALLFKLIENEPDITPETAAGALDAPDTLRLALSNPVPVYLFYWTAFPDEAGGIGFREDAYGWDAAAVRALAKRLQGGPKAPHPS